MPPSPTPEAGFEVCTVTPGFDEEICYLERVNVTSRDEAVALFAEQCGLGPEEVDPEPIHMRRVVDGDDPELGEYPVEGLPCWLECEADHPDAVPFWKDAP